MRSPGESEPAARRTSSAPRSNFASSVRASSGDSPLSRTNASTSGSRPVNVSRRCSSSPRTTPGPAQREPSRERHATEQRVEQRRLPAPVRADDGDPLAPADLDVERAEGEGASADERALEPDDDVAAARGRREPEAELPRLVRLVDRVEPLEALRRRLLHVLRLLLLAALAVALLLPLLHPAALLLDPLALGDEALPALVLARAPPLALRLVLAPAARVLARAARPHVELDDPRHRPVEEGAVVRDDDDRCRRMPGRTTRAARGRRSRGRSSARRAAARRSG